MADSIDIDKTGSEAHTAGALDIRNIIGGLLAAYGVILVLMGVLADPQSHKTGGVNANLWGGLALLVVGVGFMVWAKLKPVRVPEGFEAGDDARPAGR